MKYRVEHAGQTYDIDVEPTPEGYALRGPDGSRQLIRLQARADGSQRAATPWGEIEVLSARRGAELWAAVQGRRLSARVERLRASAGAGDAGGGTRAIVAPMAGKLLRVEVAPGDAVSAGQPLAVVEAMKMENELLAPVAGIVVDVVESAPSAVEKGALILRLEPR